MAKAKIYISYNNRDREIAINISRELKKLGYEITLDVESLTPGQEWRSIIDEALQSSEVFVSLISENSINSQYVLTELGAARAFMRTSKKMLVIPVILDEIPIPKVIEDIQVLTANSNETIYIAATIDQVITNFIGAKAAEEKEEAIVKERIETNATTFIQEAIDSLENQEKRNRWAGNLWYFLGYFTLVLGIGFGFYSISQFSTVTELEWIRFAYSGLKSIIVIGLIIACSKYSFTLGKSYMSEALKCADRIHAISFGKFYLNAYGAKASWEELKEVFQHWNIDRSSSFTSLDSNQFDPKFLEAIIEVAKAASSKVEIKK